MRRWLGATRPRGPGPTLFNLVKSAPKIKAISSSELTEEGIRQAIPPKKEVGVELNEGIWGCIVRGMQTITAGELCFI